MTKRDSAPSGRGSSASDSIVLRWCRWDEEVETVKKVEAVKQRA
jgi:hypothetical protein